MDRRIIKIKESDISQWSIACDVNKVIIEITERSKDKKTKGGIILGYNEDLVYAEGDGSHEADVAEVWGIVRAVPDKLHYDGKRQDMPWETEIEIKPADMVWFDYFASVNCDVLVSDERAFYVINYCDLYVAKRGEEIIPLNGYCLCEPIKVKHESKYAVNIGEKYVHDRVKIAHLATPNKRYQDNDAVYGTYNSDIIDVKVGDEILLRHNYKPYVIERLEETATFSDDPLYVIQRRRMELKL